MKRIVLSGLLLFTAGIVNATNPDAILGKWMTVEKNLEVEVYKTNNQYHARILWFDDHGYKAPMNQCRDDNNPDPALRSRKLVGMEVLQNLKYNPEDDDWDGGIIYDSNTGHNFDSVIYLNSPDSLTVRGYWMFTWLGQSLSFYRV